MLFVSPFLKLASLPEQDSDSYCVELQLKWQATGAECKREYDSYDFLGSWLFQAIVIRPGQEECEPSPTRSDSGQAW